MGDHQQTIELNGKYYDVITGSVISHNPTKPKVVVSIPVQQPHAGPAHHKQPTAHSVHSKAAHSHTLMRGAVHRPHVTASVVATEKPLDVLPARRTIDEWRLDRAKKIQRNDAVSRFGTIEPQTASIEVKPAPNHYRHYQDEAAAVISKPVPPPSHSAAKAPHVVAKPKTHFEAQLEKANAHHAKPLKKPRLHHRAAAKLHVKPGTLSTALVILAFILLGGYFTYLNSSVLAIRAAGAQAGVAVSIPGYTPAGFHLQSHSATPGQVTLSYKANLDTRAYSITQTVAPGSTQAMLQSIIGNQSYQTISSKGRIVFIYGNNAASWADNNSVFTVNSASTLSSNQLQQLIDSM